MWKCENDDKRWENPWDGAPTSPMLHHLPPQLGNGRGSGADHAPGAWKSDWWKWSSFTKGTSKLEKLKHSPRPPMHNKHIQLHGGKHTPAWICPQSVCRRVIGAPESPEGCPSWPFWKQIGSPKSQEPTGKNMGCNEKQLFTNRKGMEMKSPLVWPPPAAEGTKGTEGICTMRLPRGTPNFLRDIENHSTACGHGSCWKSADGGGWWKSVVSHGQVAHVHWEQAPGGNKPPESQKDIKHDMIRNLNNWLVVKTAESNPKHFISPSHLNLLTGQWKTLKDHFRNHQPNLGCTPLAIPFYHNSIPTMLTYLCKYRYIHIYILSFDIYI